MWTSFFGGIPSRTALLARPLALALAHPGTPTPRLAGNVPEKGHNDDENVDAMLLQPGSSVESLAPTGAVALIHCMVPSESTLPTQTTENPATVERSHSAPLRHPPRKGKGRGAKRIVAKMEHTATIQIKYIRSDV